ncbi:hypothetical protein [Kitasatospora sp. NPDC056800]|uniref:hypothetical protein n=1 Tax=Kitasatospora sp. NPDC056800 TaxID=3345948 RepID=UPI0036A1F81A
MLAGRTTLISAAAGADVTNLSARAPDERMAAGQVEADGVLLRNGNRAGRDDWIVTRDNNRRSPAIGAPTSSGTGDARNVLHRYEGDALRV